ncbi:MAG: FecR domain-containing protein [Candidatus Thiodiazotropha taylori]|nr:FecR domain-containing protein [Candidatus Thiodiazotropha taylori]
MVTRYTITTTFKHLFIFWLLSLSASTALHADDCQPVVARMVSLQGEAEVRRSEADSWGSASRDSSFCPGDQLRVKDNSRVGLQLNNETFLRLSEQSNIRFAPPADQQTSWLEIIKGIAHFISRITRPAQVNTPYVNASIEGTEFTVEVTDSTTLISVAEGKVRAHNSQGEALLSSGEMAETSQGNAPVVSQMVNPLDAVQWALYYPAIIDFTRQGSSSNESINRSYQAYRQSKHSEAFELLERSASEKDSDTLNFRAALNLAVGRIEAATRDIQQLLADNPQNATALALKSIVATIQNQQDSALSSAQQAVAASPDSTTALLALSYARQSRFELDKALEAATEATRQTPDNALAWSRLSQLHLMFHQMDEATAAAQKAVAINPQIALSQTTLGFSHLIELDLEDARQAFQQAISLDQASPMPRLGLGLVTIREGDLSEGRQLLETAVHLDPGNALLRSYLGKAYYEEKRNDEAGKQFELAKQRDPLDPTAWFYDAILKQSENRPVEALTDIQHAIDLNDNRAIYRSRLLLDDDQASRNISQARIFTNLGADGVARKESSRSLINDPGNASAHLFLSEAYSGLVRHEKAQVSELLQAQLLQPEITLPVSPSSSVADLHAFSGSGPSVAGFNEYNPMFNRKGVSVLLSGVTGGNNTRGSEIALGGFTNRGMLSAGHYRESSDGFRINNDSDQTISNLFGQYRITPELSVQGEIRQREGNFGDLAQRFDPDVFSRSSNRAIDSDTYRLSANYSPSNQNIFLINAIQEDLSDGTEIGSLVVDGDRENSQYEGQYVYQGNLFKVVSGFTFADEDSIITTSIPTPFGLITQTEMEDKEGSNGYIYIHIPWSKITGVIGAEYAQAEDNIQIDESQINPKLGAIWDITDNSTLRIAAFRTLRANFINQSLNPTQVAGFNQVFDDSFGSDAWRYGIALDSVLLNNLYGGVEFTRRTLTSFLSADTLPVQDQEEENHSAYINWILTNNTIMSGRYFFDDFESDYIDGEVIIDQPVEMNTQTLSLSIKHSTTIGLFAELEAVHISQEINDTLETGGLTSSSDRFWLGNISLGMKLPKRTGILALDIHNVFDREFNYQSIDPGTGTPVTSSNYPERYAIVRAHVWF